MYFKETVEFKTLNYGSAQILSPLVNVLPEERVLEDFLILKSLKLQNTKLANFVKKKIGPKTTN
jgi:hypothetical protein